MFRTCLLLVSLAISPLIHASALPQQTPFTNYTGGFPSGAAAGTGCPTNCRRKVVALSSISWSSLSVTATITAETVLFVVNNRTNSTLVTTVTNTEVDLKTYVSATDLNSAGTRTTAVVATNNHTTTTYTVAYPTVYHQDYPSDYTICGTLPTTVSGVATCIQHPCIREMRSGLLLDPSGFDSGAPSFTFSSHPAIAWPTRTQAMGNLGLDPKGLTYEPVWSFEGDWEERVQPLFPELAVWKCMANRLERPDRLKATALYLTATSTVMESHLLSELPSYASGTLLRTHEDGAGQAPTTTSSPLISKPEEAATSLPETPSGNTPNSNSAVQATSAVGVLGSQQVPSRAPKDDAATSSGLADGNVPTSAVEATSPTKVLSSDQLSSRPVARVSTPISASPENVGQSAIILTTTYPKGSPIVTTLAVTGAAPGNDVAPITLNSHIISTDANAQYLVSGQPLIPGSPVTLGSGAGATPVVIHTSSRQTFLVVGSSTSILAGILTAAAVQALSIGTQVLEASSENLYVVGTRTLTPNVPITLGSGDAATPVEMHTSSSHTILVFGSRTQTLFAGPTPLVPAAPAALTIGSQIIGVISEGGYIIGSQTLAPSVPITLGSNSATTPLLLQTTSRNMVLIIGSSTSTLIAAATVTPQPLAIGSEVVSVNSQNQYIVGSQTLAPGSPITLGSGVAGTPVLLQTSGTQTILVAGSITSTLVGTATAPPPFTIGGQVVTANAQDQYVVGSQTLTPGAAITVAGTPISLAPSGNQVVVGTSTDGLGNYIMNGLGAGPSASASASASASGAVPFKGAAGRQFHTTRTSAIWGSAMAVLMAWLYIGIM